MFTERKKRNFTDTEFVKWTALWSGKVPGAAQWLRDCGATWAAEAPLSLVGCYTFAGCLIFEIIMVKISVVDTEKSERKLERLKWARMTQNFIPTPEVKKLLTLPWWYWSVIKKKWHTMFPSMSLLCVRAAGVNWTVLRSNGVHVPPLHI